MSTLDDKKNASETRFVLDAAKEFKSEAKRNTVSYTHLTLPTKA